MADPLLHRACFGDTGFFYALWDAGDFWHGACRDVLKQLQRQQRPVVSTTLVIAETHALMLRRLGRTDALEWLHDAQDWVARVPVEPVDESQALHIIQTYNDQDFSLTDAVSFSIMGRLGIQIALATDHHFTIYSPLLHVLPIAGAELPEH